MRKLFGFLAVGALTVTLLSGCASSSLKDGTYVGTSGADDRGSFGVATITVKSGKISEVGFQEINGSNGLAKSTENGYTYQTSLDAMKNLPAKLLATKDVSKVDNVTGATGTTEKFKAAANSALAQADKSYKTALRNGTYTLKTGLDTHGYYSVLTTTITNNQFGNVTYQEYNQDGKTKLEAGYTYQAGLDAIVQLPAKMNSVKDLTKVDDVTGASSTSGNFKAMTQMSLDLAGSRDGFYSYESQPDDHGNKVSAMLALNSGKIVGYQFAEITSTGKSKIDPASGYTYAEALTFLAPEHIKQVISTQYGVDQVSGATSSFTNFGTALKALVQLAK